MTSNPLERDDENLRKRSEDCLKGIGELEKQERAVRNELETLEKKGTA